MNFAHLRSEWVPNTVTRELLAGAVVALALIPEAIAFSIIAGVDPKVGLFASFSIAVIIAFAAAFHVLLNGDTATPVPDEAGRALRGAYESFRGTFG